MVECQFISSYCYHVRLQFLSDAIFSRMLYSMQFMFYTIHHQMPQGRGFSYLTIQIAVTAGISVVKMWILSWNNSNDHCNEITNNRNGSSSISNKKLVYHCFIYS